MSKILTQLMAQNLSYCEPKLKNKFHLEATKVLSNLARVMALHRDDYSIRSDKAGIAVSGQVTLHCEMLYIQISQSVLNGDACVLYRTCQGQKDYIGGMNRFAPVSVLQNLNKFASRLSEISGVSFPSAGTLGLDVSRQPADRHAINL